ncbi:ABC transporter permease [Sporosarcina limicola]|uniref:ABC transporter permease n=1 Tax=Sporosarcina limicola TaxID=34101 RepID=UPI00178BB140|nr:ABC transporter permease [Sporosarcina limicola]
MQSIRTIIFFFNQYNKQVKKKWATLLLLFLFPICLIGLLLGLIAGLIMPPENTLIRVILVDEDGTKESMLFTRLLEETATDNQFIQIVSMTKEHAERLMEQNEVSAYFSFPEGFTADLYEGESVTIPIVGNPSKPTESQVIKQLVDSMARLLATAQANILTINDYAKKLDMSKSEREEMLLQQFMDFTLYTLGKNKLLDEEVIANVATSSPKHYYILAGWFTLLSIWLLAFYMVVGKEEHAAMLVRMKLFGVTIWQRIFARILVSLSGSLLFAAVMFYVIEQFIQYDLYVVDYLRFGLFAFLYGLLFLIGVAVIDVWISSRKIVLLLQSLFTFFLLFISGAVIPTLYFPQAVQGVLPFVFSYETMNWLIDIVLEERNYADFTKMMVSTGIGLVLLRLSTIAKERWSR